MRLIDSSSDLTLGEIDPNGVEYFDVSMVRQKELPPEPPKLYGEYAFAVLGVLTLGAACVFAFGCTPVASSRYDPALLYPQGGVSGQSQGNWSGNGGVSLGGHGGVGGMLPVAGSVGAPPGPGVAQCFWPSTAHCDGDLTACEPLNTLRNCGQCGNRCAIPGARETCRNRSCEMLGCLANRGDCDFVPWNGCETQLLHDLWNCGGCGISCAHLPGTTAGRCEDGECVVAACLPGLGDCNEEPQDGCETRLGTQQHCGGCDQRCGGGLTNAVCAGGACQFLGCAPGAADCRGNGRCVSLSTSDNCGACGVRCPQGTRCQAGVCL